MAGDLLDELAFSARELERLALDLTRLTVRVRAVAAQLGGPAARAGAEWSAALDRDASAACELATDTRRATCALESYTALPVEVRRRAEAPPVGPDESALAWILRILAALLDGGTPAAGPRQEHEPSVWSSWSPPVRVGTGPRLAGTDGERVETDQGVRVAELPDGG